MTCRLSARTILSLLLIAAALANAAFHGHYRRPHARTSTAARTMPAPVADVQVIPTADSAHLGAALSAGLAAR